jgi:hypothetical protein
MGETHDTKYKVNIVLGEVQFACVVYELAQGASMFICLTMFAIGCFTFGLVVL